MKYWSQNFSRSLLKFSMSGEYSKLKIPLFKDRVAIDWGVKLCKSDLEENTILYENLIPRSLIDKYILPKETPKEPSNDAQPDNAKSQTEKNTIVGNNLKSDSQSLKFNFQQINSNEQKNNNTTGNQFNFGTTQSQPESTKNGKGAFGFSFNGLNTNQKDNKQESASTAPKFGFNIGDFNLNQTKASSESTTTKVETKQSTPGFTFGEFSFNPNDTKPNSTTNAETPSTSEFKFDLSSFGKKDTKPESTTVSSSSGFNINGLSFDKKESTPTAPTSLNFNFGESSLNKEDKPEATKPS